MSELLRYIAQNLVDRPDQVRVETREDADGLAYELHVAQEDIGKIIGKFCRLYHNACGLASN